MTALVLVLFMSLFFRFVWVELIVTLMILTMILAVDFCSSYTMIGYWHYCDTLSFFLSYLSVWIVCLMVTSSMAIYSRKLNYYLFNQILVILLMTLIVTFFIKSMFFFYFFFEFSLIPTILLIMGWGYQVERVQASIYFLIYTMFASLPLLLLIFFFSFYMEIYYFIDLDNSKLFLGSGLHEFFFIWMALGAFMVKLPIYLFHLWLPKAHVEAPVSGSMILAGVLLKLGGYGVVRFSSFLKSFMVKWGMIIFSVALVSVLVVGIFCCRSNDMKTLVAYSSISHMGLALCGLVSFYCMGLIGSLFMLLGHGVCSSGMFSFINMIYDRTGSRSFYVNKGLMNLILSSSLLLFLISITNMSAPPTMNLFSEVFLMMSVINYSSLCLMALVLGSFMVACYTIFFFSFSQQGKYFANNFSLAPLSLPEIHNMVSHITILNISFMLMSLIM